MKRFVEGVSHDQSTLFPESLDDFVDTDNAVRVVDAFMEELDLGGLGFARVAAKATGRPSYYPTVPLKLYIHGYLNRVRSSRRLEREAARNVEVMWLIQGEGIDAAALLGQRPRNLCDQGSLHDRGSAPRHALGTRTSPRGCSTPPR